MDITVIGAGYVGLITAVCFAEFGNRVICIEKQKEKLDLLNKGISPIYEPGLSELLEKNINKKLIRFTSDIKEGIKESNIIFLCVGTPQRENGEADMSQVEEASRQIAMHTTDYKLVIEKSTVPVNTHQWVKRILNRYSNCKTHFDVASNPEFLREGNALYDFLNPDRIVVGVESSEAENIFRELYKPLTDKGVELIITTPATAELIKHSANSFLAMKISYINMIAELCEKVGADIEMVAKGIGLDKRIGRSFLNAGIGYGGSCFPKDVKAFIKIAEENGVEFGLLKETEKINKMASERFIKKIENVLWVNKDKNIAVWGLSFKPDTDDIREAPSIHIIKKLNEANANLFLYDPKAMDHFKKLFPESSNIKYGKDKYEVLKNADALIILTEWKDFNEENLDFNKMKDLMRLKIIIDGRNIYDIQRIREKGFEYYPVGREKFNVEGF